jgi:hypothetical protein
LRPLPRAAPWGSSSPCVKMLTSCLAITCVNRAGEAARAGCQPARGLDAAVHGMARMRSPRPKAQEQSAAVSCKRCPDKDRPAVASARRCSRHIRGFCETDSGRGQRTRRRNGREAILPASNLCAAIAKEAQTCSANGKKIFRGPPDGHAAYITVDHASRSSQGGLQSVLTILPSLLAPLALPGAVSRRRGNASRVAPGLPGSWRRESPFAPRKWRCFRGTKGDYGDL